MTGWQMAMELYHAMPTPLADRQPMNDTTGRKVECDEQAVDSRNRDPVSVEEVAMFRELSAQGWSASRISTATGRSKKSVLRYLKGERTPRE